MEMEMEMGRGMVVRMDFDLPVAIVMYGSHGGILEKFFPQDKLC
ncbi:MAG: hypothetical protein ACRYF8_09210 [Janthinobacterium lividum]|jgi:hypothetical protein